MKPHACFLTGLLVPVLLVSAAETPSAEVKPAPAAPAAVRIAMIGDSLTHEGNWTRLLARDDVVNWGFPGYTTGQLAWNYGNLAKQQPGLKAVFLQGGINDLSLGVTVDRVYQNQVRAIAWWRERGIVPVLVLIVLQASAPKMNENIGQLNTRLAEYCAENKVDFVDPNTVLAAEGRLKPDLTTDGTHLKPEAYGLWSGLIATKVKQLGL